MSENKKSGFWKKVKRILLVLFIAQLAYIILCRWIDPPITLTQLVNVAEGYGLKRDYISFEEMGKNIKLAVMASEDQRFPQHEGFDIESIEKAMEYNKKHPKKTRGASTISQQTAKNVFLWQHGGYLRKSLEVYFTFMIELIWSKDRILETYLNVAEMGPGIFGVEAAAQKYFHKHAKNLTRQEAAAIAACLPNPKRYIVNPPGRYVQRRTGKIMIQMNFIEGEENVKELLSK
jgi:monofunctional biosynthetic peptidoglycan transglycosylase